MYYVNYVSIRNGENITERFETQSQAIHFYRANISNMAYGYISDDDALEVAETVKADFERELKRQKINLFNEITNNANNNELNDFERVLLA